MVAADCSVLWCGFGRLLVPHPPNRRLATSQLAEASGPGLGRP